MHTCKYAILYQSFLTDVSCMILETIRVMRSLNMLAPRHFLSSSFPEQSSPYFVHPHSHHCLNPGLSTEMLS